MSIEPHDISAADGTRLRLWERSSPEPTHAVVFVHGATYASRAIFAPDGAPTFSWLEAVADAGGAGFGLDIRGYGDSERPAAMDGPPDAADPPVRADVAASDLRDAIETVRERVDGDVHLVGTSWGTMIAGRMLAADDAPPVASATFHAPVYRPRAGLVEQFAADDSIPAYRTVHRDEARSRWDDQIPTDDPATYRGGSEHDDPVFDAFWTALVESGQRVDDASITAPNGTLLDLLDGASGKPVYDPSGIDVPTLIIRGSLDPTSTRTDAIELYDSLAVPADERSYVEIAGGTHFIHLERRRHALYDAVRCFQKRYRR